MTIIKVLVTNNLVKIFKNLVKTNNVLFFRKNIFLFIKHKKRESPST